jgi:hypothetical protein
VWVLCKSTADGELFWTGRTNTYARPSLTPFVSEAYHFRTAQEAYTAADTHRHLRDSDDWRVRRRSATCERMA